MFRTASSRFETNRFGRPMLPIESEANCLLREKRFLMGQAQEGRVPSSTTRHFPARVSNRRALSIHWMNAVGVPSYRDALPANHHTAHRDKQPVRVRSGHHTPQSIQTKRRISFFKRMKSAGLLV